MRLLGVSVHNLGDETQVLNPEGWLPFEADDQPRNNRC